MKRSTEAILTTHTGSLPRTTQVLEMLHASIQGTSVDENKFETAVAKGVDEVVRHQVDIGISIVNDGEMSKYSFTTYHMQRLSGFTLKEVPALPPGPPIAAEGEDYPEFFEHWAFNAGVRAAQDRETMTVPVCTDAIAYEGVGALQRDIANVMRAVQLAGGSEVFMTAVPPTGMGGGFGANEFYATEEEYNVAMADALRVEYEAIVAAGIVLQFDCNWGVLSRIAKSSVEEVRSIIGRSIELLNYASRNIDPDLMRIHLCWGADEAPHHRDLPLSDIVDLMITARPNGLGVVASNGRHEWEWQLWKDIKVPEGKVIIPGVIDSTTNIIEHPETVSERIIRFANVLGRENVIAGVDCGLDTVAGSAQVQPRIAWAKLEALAEGARRATSALY